MANIHLHTSFPFATDTQQWECLSATSMFAASYEWIPTPWPKTPNCFYISYGAATYKALKVRLRLFFSNFTGAAIFIIVCCNFG